MGANAPPPRYWSGPPETAVAEGRQFAPPKEVWLPGENPKSIGKAHYIRPFVGLREDRNLVFRLRADEASCRDSA